MFFRRNRPKIPTFSERLALLQNAGFLIDTLPDGRGRISKHGVGALVGDEGKGHSAIEKAGILVGKDIAILLSGGNQMFLEIPSGQRLPATAEQLHSLHEFEEDVKEGLELTSLYNTSLGTTSQKHVYDRVYKRDTGDQPKPWEKKQTRIVPPETKSAPIS